MLFSTLHLSHRRPTGDPVVNPCRPLARRAVSAWLIAAVALIPASAMAGGPIAFVSLADGDGPIHALSAGKDLHVDIAGLAPGGKVRLLLLDEASTVIASRDLATDREGNVATHEPLWPRTGVVGCDDDVVVDPTSYTFSTFDDAEAHLDGRRFRVEVRDLETEDVIAQHPLPVTRETSTPIFYFADGRGCPRSSIQDNESLYLAAHGLSGDGLDVIFFLVEGGFPPSPGEFLSDVRESGQGIEIDFGQQKFLELVWASPVVGEYGGVARFGNEWTPRFMAGDTWIGGSGSASGEFLGRISPHGITVTPWDCPGCPIDP